jgi:hypothetical protein
VSAIPAMSSRGFIPERDSSILNPAPVSTACALSGADSETETNATSINVAKKVFLKDGVFIKNDTDTIPLKNIIVQSLV